MTTAPQSESNRPTLASEGVTPSEGVAPLDLLRPILRRWWWMTLLIFAGGLTGLLVSWILPPEVESGFRVYTGIEVSLSGELTQYEEDILYAGVGELLIANSTRQIVAERAAQSGLTLPDNFFLTNTVTERRLSTWQVRVRHTDPALVETLASIWLQVGREELQKAYTAAITADGLQRRLESLENCLERSAVNPPASGVCAGADLQVVQQQLAETGAALAQARSEARGLSSSLLIDTAQPELLPAQPTFRQRGAMALAGAALGFIAGVWLVQRGGRA